MFVVFEGIDGAGKTTQAKLLTQRLQADGIKAEQVFDPGTTKVGQAIRKILLETDEPMTVMAQMLLFSAARAELAEHIAARISAGVLVVCDRWLLSTLVYQGEINGVPPDLILSIFRGTSPVTPDVCVLLDLDPESAAVRMGAPRDRYERRSLADRRRMRAAYHKYAAQENLGGELFMLDATTPIDDTHDRVYQHVRFVFDAKRAATSI